MSQKKLSGAPFGVQTSRWVSGFVRFCSVSDLLMPELSQSLSLVVCILSLFLINFMFN